MFGLCKSGGSACAHDMTIFCCLYLVWIANFLHNVVNLGDGQVNDLLLHPLGDFEFFNELVLDVGHDLVAESLCFSRERLLNKESTQDPTKSEIDVADTLSPALWLCIRVLI